MNARTTLFAALLAATLAGQQPAKIPAPPSTGPDIKTAADLASKVERPAPSPLLLRTPAAATKTPGSTAADAAPAPALQLPQSLLHDSVDGRLWTVGGTYKVSFGREGATFLPYFADAECNHPMTFAVRAASVAGQALPVLEATPTRRDDLVTFDHGGMRAVYELRQHGIEQMFWFDRLPLRGELRLDVSLATDLHAEHDGGGFVFTDPRGRVTYSAAVAIDAKGNRLPLTTELENGVLRFRVPAAFVATATLPLCIDPLVNSTQIAYTTANNHPAWQSDIAYEPSYGEYLVVFERQWSLTDRDVYARRYTFDLASGTTQVLDSTTVDWSQPRVAANNLANRFLMVAKVSNGNVSPFWISGRLVDANTGTLGVPFDIERASLPGHAGGNKINPDVGGDMDYYGPTYFTVVWERVVSAADHDVHCKQVDGNGVLRSASPTLIDNSVALDSYPRISKTDGTPPYATQCWGIVWERAASPTDQDIYAAAIRWDGFVTVASHFMDSSTANTWRPTVSSPTDATTGYRNYLIAYEKDVAGNNDIVGTMMEEHGYWLGQWNLSQNLNGAWPQYAPTIDSDGARFAVGWTQLYGGSGTDFDTVLATFGWSLAQGLVLQDSGFPGYSTDAEYDMSITSTHAAGSGAGRYGACWTHSQNNAPNNYLIEARLYDGMSANGGFSMRLTSCGTDANFAVFGAPVLGGWFHLSQTLTTGLRGYVFGAPDNTPLGPCLGCTIGVSGFAILGSELQVEVPADPSFVGMLFSCQGFSFDAGPCFGTLSLSDTLDLVLR
ncbi:MAG: hypothetical protein ABIP94_08150 [Planctomycetota bacterium]